MKASESVFLIMSHMLKTIQKDYIFCNWHFAVLKASVNEESKKFELCINTECLINLIENLFL